VTFRAGTGASHSLLPVLGISVLSLVGCASPATAPVTDRAVAVRHTDAEYRDVIAGDTLYSIAWESGRDYRELAEWNRIAPPYTIKVGQRIHLQAPATPLVKARTPTSHTVQRGETMFSIASRYDVGVADLATWNNIATPYTIKPSQTLRLTQPEEKTLAKPEGKSDERKPRKPDAPRTTSSRKTAPANNNAKVSSSTVGAWAWPVDGNLLTRFNAGNAKGIDIGGKPGAAVVAAAPGTVVYQGSGLRGYGQLIIVKHSTDFLSAYAHCDKIVVREGNVIKRGQKIAEMGSTGTDRVKLHFEIRYRGTPVDPLDHLPKR
jgi:lipoprotein NlpD